MDALVEVRTLDLRARDLRPGDVIATGEVERVGPVHRDPSRPTRYVVNVTRRRGGRKPYTSAFGASTSVRARRRVELPQMALDIADDFLALERLRRRGYFASWFAWRAWSVA